MTADDTETAENTAALDRQPLLSRKHPCVHACYTKNHVGGVDGEFASTPSRSIRAEESKHFLMRTCLHTWEQGLLPELSHCPDDHQGGWGVGMRGVKRR